MTELLDSRYRVEEKIGNGGMGEVYRATDTLKFDESVAIKSIVVDNPDVMVTFRREAKILCYLKHPALPRFDAFNENSQPPYFIMEYIEGDDLKTLVEKRNSPFDAEKVKNWTIQLLDVIGYLHQQGIHHRDIKPSNIKVLKNQVYLLDFGISYGQVGEMSTFDGSFLWQSGTKDFSSLEQLNGIKTTNASDLYSLGATIYFLLTGNAPINPKERRELLTQGKLDPLANISSLVPSIDKNFANAIMASLELDPLRRPQTAEQMLQIISPVDVTTSYTTSSDSPQRKPKAFIKKLGFAIGLMSLIVMGMFLGGAVVGIVFGEKTTAVSISPEEEAIELTDEAVALVQSAKYQEAEIKCEQALAKNPNYAYAHFVYGDIKWDTSSDNESLEELTEVQNHANRILTIITIPKTPKEFVSRAWANLVKQRLDAAISDSTKALELKPNFISALMVRGTAKSSKSTKDSLGAFNDYNKVVELMPQYAQAIANRADSHFKLGKYEWAVDDYSDAIKVLPFARYYFGKGEALFAMGKYSDAKLQYQEALKINPEYYSPYVRLAEVFFQEKDWKNSVKHLSEAIKIKPVFESYKNRGIAYAKLKKFSKAIKDFNKALKLDGSSSSTYYHRGAVFYTQKRYRKALLDITKAIKNLSEDEKDIVADLYNFRANIYHKLDQHEKEKLDSEKAKFLAE